MRYLLPIIALLMFASCENKSTVSQHIHNNTEYNTTMYMYSMNKMQQSFDIEQKSIVCIWEETGMDPDILRIHNFDSIHFVFSNGAKLLYYINNTSGEKNIFGDYWIDEYPGKHHHKFIFVIEEEDLE